MYANAALKNNEAVYELWHNCSADGHNIEHIMGNFLSTAQKHNRQNLEHIRSGPSESSQL